MDTTPLLIVCGLIALGAIVQTLNGYTRRSSHKDRYH